MAKSVFKAQAEARDLANNLSLRLTGANLNTVRQANDAGGWPMIFLSVGANEAEGQPVMLLRIMGYAVPAPDVFGQQQYAYAPHTLELAYELKSTGAPFPVESDILKVMYESTMTGITILQKEIANGTAVTETSLNAAAVVSELNNTFWPNKGV